ncbi:HTTM domain-containing protein [Streptomyces monticola]|uniref:HTTM domain-containing protein n=1 Tax=Streptomyces monticola TaxID=2666263 RepID=A0ABW2JCF0_9ACTN
MSGRRVTTAPGPWPARHLATARSTLFAPYQTAILRIGVAGTYLLWLLVEFPDRRELFGPDGPWSWELVSRSVARDGHFSVLLWSDSMLWFEICYALSLAVIVCMLLGWRTRATGVLFVIVVLSFTNRNDFAMNAGNNILRLMALYLLFARCSHVWSLDARRAGRRRRDGKGPARDRTGPLLWSALGAALVLVTALSRLTWGWALFFWGLWAVQGIWWWAARRPGTPQRALDMITHLLHNGAVLMIMAQVCLIYATAGWYKVQGELWQDGTAVYYSAQLEFLNAWPALSDLMTANSVVVLLLTYGTVMVQVAFPFSLLRQRAKNVLLVLLIGEHIGIGVLMGLPYFSLAMIAADLVFLPTPAALWAGRWVLRLRSRLRPAAPGDPEPGRSAGTRTPAGVG